MSKFNKSCYNCELAEIHPGTIGSYDCPPEPEEVYCKAEQEGRPGFPSHMYEAFMEAYNFQSARPLEEILPLSCGHYTPVMVEKCGQCGKAIGEELRLWQIFGLGWEAVPCCTPKCATALSEEFEKEHLG